MVAIATNVFSLAENILMHGAEVHKLNIRVKRWHNKCENSELDCRTTFV